MVQVAELLEVPSRRGSDYIRWLQGALNQFADARLPVNGVMGPDTRAVLRSFQKKQELPADGVAGPRTESALIAAGASPPRGAEVPKPYPDVTQALSTPGPGYRSYKKGWRQFGTPETIRAIRAIGAKWRAKHPRGPRLSIGDISFRGGGPMDDHVSHSKGVDFDVLLMRSDGREDPVDYTAPKYSRSLTQQLVNLIQTNGVLHVKIIFFNDPNVSGVACWPHHHNHLHVRFAAPGLPPRPVTRREAALSEYLDQLCEEEWFS